MARKKFGSLRNDDVLFGTKNRGLGGSKKTTGGSLRNADVSFGTKNRGLGGSKKTTGGSLRNADVSFGTKNRGLEKSKDQQAPEAQSQNAPPLAEQTDQDGRVYQERIRELEDRLDILQGAIKNLSLVNGRLSALEARLTGNDPFYQPKMPRFEEGVGMKITQYPNRIRFDAVLRTQVTASTPPHPWQTTRNDDGETKRVSVRPGTFNSIVPTNIFTPLTITGSSVEFVVATLTVTSSSPASVLLSIESTPPIPSATTEGVVPITASDVIAVVSDGVVYQVRSKNIRAESYEVFRNPVASPEYGELNYVPWYRWEIKES